MQAIIRRTRRQAVAALAAAVRTVLAGREAPSEADFRDAWLAELRHDADLLPDGWYAPPPHGLAVLIGHPPGYERLAVPTFRTPDAWPRADLLWAPECVMYAYASPVDRETGLIGDLAVVLYAGEDERVAAHLAECRRLATAIAQRAGVGMPYSALHADAMAELRRRGYANDIASSADPAGTNIGHTIPLTHQGRTPRDVVPGVPAEELRRVISTSRLFLSGRENQRVTPGVVFTVEPRIGAPGLPTVGYHLLVEVDEQGRSSVVDDLAPAEDAYREAVLARRR